MLVTLNIILSQLLYTFNSLNVLRYSEKQTKILTTIYSKILSYHLIRLFEKYLVNTKENLDL